MPRLAPRRTEHLTCLREEAAASCCPGVAHTVPLTSTGTQGTTNWFTPTPYWISTWQSFTRQKKPRTQRHGAGSLILLFTPVPQPAGRDVACQGPHGGHTHIHTYMDPLANVNLVPLLEMQCKCSLKLILKLGKVFLSPVRSFQVWLELVSTNSANYSKSTNSSELVNIIFFFEKVEKTLPNLSFSYYQY